MTPRAGFGRFVRDAGRVFGGQLAMTAIGVGTGVITARWLGPEGRGVFQLVVVVVPFMLANLVKLGIPQASVYAIKREQVSPSTVVSNSIWLALLLGIVTGVGCWLGEDWILANLLKEAPRVTLAAVVILVPAVILQAYLLGVVQALERFREYNVQQIVPNVLGLIGMATVLIYLGQGVVGAVFTFTGIMLFVTGWLALRVHRLAPIRAAMDVGLLRRMLRFGLKSHAQTLAATWHLRVDQLLIGYLLDPAQVGLYAVAVNLTNLLLRIPDALGTVLFPRLAGASTRVAEDATALVCRCTAGVMVLGAVAYVLVGPAALRLLFGERFTGSVAPMLALLPGIVMMGQYLILTRNFTSQNRQEINIVAASAALAGNVALNVLLIPRYGIVGAALSSVGSYGLAAGILMVAFVRTSDKRLTDVLLPRPTDLRHVLARRGRTAP
jgi:O-antigen/teichoic acid export membrane protein